MHLRLLAQMDPQKGKESSLKIDVSNMYIRFDVFSGFLSSASRRGRWRSIFAKHFHFRALLEIYTRISGQSAALPTTLHPFNTFIVPCSHARSTLHIGRRKKTKARSWGIRTEIRRGENTRAKCVTNGSWVNDQGPGLFEKDLKIFLYELY